MPRAMTPAHHQQNAAFLDALARTGNVRLAARETKVAYGTVQHRRGRHADFAQACDAAIEAAQAHLHADGKQHPVALPAAPDPHRTQGGEAVVVRRCDGKLQVRRAHAGKLTKQCEQAFLLALAATANATMSAAAAGASFAAFARRRRQDPGFAREWRLALQQGYATLEAALIEGFTVDAHVDDAWRHNDPPALPPMTTAQALQLMYLHQKEARLLAEPAHLKRRRGESAHAYSQRLSGMYEEGLRRDREAYDMAQAERRAQAHARRRPHEPARPPAPLTLPDLAQVTGWSKADPAKQPHGDAALFGGWRVADMTGRDAQRAAAKKGRTAARKKGRG